MGAIEQAAGLNVAFKEWAVVVDALLRGTQSVLLRKGGIHEGPEGFRPEHPRFLLFPTQFHQHQSKVKPAFLQAYQSSDRQRPKILHDQHRLEAWAEISRCVRVTALETLTALDSFHAWTLEEVRSRFDRGDWQGLYALTVRVHRLSFATMLPMKPEYSGCKSWIEIESPVSIADSSPVLDDTQFQKVDDLLQSCLNGK